MSAVEVTGVEQQRAWIEGAFPPVERIRPGVWSIPVPMQGNPLRYVLVYAFEADDGLAIFDTGWDTPDAWAALQAGLDRFGATPSDVTDVVVTHMHPDHYGLAGRVRSASGARVHLGREDARLLRGRYIDADYLASEMRTLLVQWGVGPDDVELLSGASLELLENVEVAEPDVVLDDGDVVAVGGRRFTSIWTPGHSPGHMCFVEERERYVLTGDHVLPRISPNVSVHVQQRPNPLEDYLWSLGRMAAYDVDEAFPAHEYRFGGLTGRVIEMAGHHRDRLSEIVGLLDAAPQQTAWELSTHLHWSRPWIDIAPFMRRAAVGETVAHLLLLESLGGVERTSGPPERWRAGPRELPAIWPVLEQRLATWHPAPTGDGHDHHHG